MQNRATDAGFRWDSAGFGITPDLIRFSRLLGTGDTQIEVEFLMFGEEVGRIFDVEVYQAADWLAKRLIPKTFELQQAIDFGYTFGDTVYKVAEDRFINVAEENYKSDFISR